MVDAAPAAPPMQRFEVAKPAPKSSKRPEPLHVVREVLGAAAQRAVLARVPGDLGGLAADAAEGVRLDLVGGPPAEAFAAARRLPRRGRRPALRRRRRRAFQAGGSAPLACTAAAYRAGGGMAAHVDAGGCKPLCVLNLGLACDFGAAAATARRARDGAGADAGRRSTPPPCRGRRRGRARVLMFYAAPAPRARDDDFGDVPDGAAGASAATATATATTPDGGGRRDGDGDGGDGGGGSGGDDASDPPTAPTPPPTERAALCERLGLAGRLRVAVDGLNGTLGGSERALEAYVAATTAAGRSAVDGGSLDGVDWKWGEARGDAPVAGQRLRVCASRSPRRSCR
ncbi:hypothetical protein JL722_15084 [Aureococcus anophagefferens]|nr:hypothetical protein JL722_15084 [Aureococcus anophagefferens]